MSAQPRAACAGEPTTIFFPEPLPGFHQIQPWQYDTARAICATCPAHEDCRQAWIEAERPAYGVWFGTTPRARSQQQLGRGRLVQQCRCGRALTLEQQRARRHYCGPDCADIARREQIARHDATKRHAS